MTTESASKKISQNENLPEKVATIQITDMESYSRKTSGMSPSEIRDFVIEYHENLRSYITQTKGADHYDSLAGDSSVAIYCNSDDPVENSVRAIRIALKTLRAIHDNQLLPTRMGLFAGTMIEADFGHQRLQFGGSFAAAARLEQLCGYFGVYLLMDRDVARADKQIQRYAVSIGKITPKNFNHPIHAYTFYQPGINNCPEDINGAALLEFIDLKNSAMEYFSGNALKNIDLNFPRARSLLLEASALFTSLTNRTDIPTQLILDYISEFSTPPDDFQELGMKIGSSSYYQTSNLKLRHLPEKLLKQYDDTLHRYLLEDIGWLHYFKLEWIAARTVIIRVGDMRDGVFFVETGSAIVKDENNKALTHLANGDIFGEMAYFTPRGKHLFTVEAVSDMVIRKMSHDDLERFPGLTKILLKIAGDRITPFLEKDEVGIPLGNSNSE